MCEENFIIVQLETYSKFSNSFLISTLSWVSCWNIWLEEMSILPPFNLSISAFNLWFSSMDKEKLYWDFGILSDFSMNDWTLCFINYIFEGFTWIRFPFFDVCMSSGHCLDKKNDIIKQDNLLMSCYKSYVFVFDVVSNLSEGIEFFSSQWGIN